ncbi:MAG: hypothetical protein IJX18_03670, partial [Clostridia bacterium]|nr:hypothetical protein [Clostridia bacterium]
MTTDFFWKVFKTLVAVVATTVLVVGGIYAVELSNCVYATEYTFYFVGVKEGGTEACAQQVVLEGGAGYLYDEKVMLATYFSKEKAESVKEKVVKKYPSATIYTLSTTGVLLQKEDKSRKEAMLDNLYRHIQALAEVAESLDNGLTQEKAKSRLRILQTSFDMLAKTYSREKEMKHTCENAAKWLQEEGIGVVY